MLKNTLIVLFLTALFIFNSMSCANRINYIPLGKQDLKGYGTIYFVPINEFPDSEIEKLRAYYLREYNLEIQTLPRLSLNSSALDFDREQIIAEAVIASMKKEYYRLTQNSKAILIGLTAEDMYIGKYDWRFSFSYRESGKYAVVSNARMNLESFTDASVPDARLRKMVTKNIGLLYYRLPPSEAPQSVLYKNVGGIDELDQMGEEF